MQKCFKSTEIIHNLLIIALLFIIGTTSQRSLVQCNTQASSARIARINCGGLALTDATGVEWSADEYYNLGTRLSTDLSLLTAGLDSIYLTERKNDNSRARVKYEIPLTVGNYLCSLHFAEASTQVTVKGQRVFDVLINDEVTLSSLDIFDKVGAGKKFVHSVNCTTMSNGRIQIALAKRVGIPKINAIEVSSLDPIPEPSPSPEPGGSTSHSTPAESSPVKPGGVGGFDHIGHSVITIQSNTVVDINNAGKVTVTLDGKYSHTHAPAPVNCCVFEWSYKGVVIGTQVTVDVSMPIGANTVVLKVTDTKGNSADSSVTINVVPPIMQGLEAYYYQYTTSLDAMPAYEIKPTYAQLEDDLNYRSSTAGTNNFKGAPFDFNFGARYVALLRVPTTGSYLFSTLSADGSVLSIDGKVVVDNNGLHQLQEKVGTPITLTQGDHNFECKFFRGGTSYPGIVVNWQLPGAGLAPIPASAFYHSESKKVPVLFSVSPVNGPPTGGNTLTLSGYGFVFLTGEIIVNLGPYQCINVQVVDSQTIQCTSPAAPAGQVAVSVQSPTGTSNSISFVYTADAPPAILWKGFDSWATNIPNPTVLNFGPDDKLYIGSVNGQILRLTLSDDMTIQSTFTSNVLIGRNILGLSFNPLDTDPNNVRLYVAHNQLYHDTTTDQLGMVSVISGANLDNRVDIITGLPVSERDHGINGISFSQDLDLYVNAGSNTNGGIPGPLTPSGTQQEKQLSACMLECKKCGIKNLAAIDGKVTYTNNDNLNGNQITGMDVSCYAYGIKNSFASVIHSNGKIYCVDNGPSITYGASSASCTTEGPNPGTQDKFLIVEKGKYYGHPVRARGIRGDTRQCKYRSPSEPSDADYTAPISILPSSTDGILEYQANAFRGSMKGSIVASRFTGELWRIILTADGSAVQEKGQLHALGGLNVAEGYEGQLLACDYYNNKITMITPNEPAITSLFIMSVRPHRGVIAGGNTITVRGYQFAAGLTATIGGKACTNVQFISNRKFKCNIPAGTANALVGIQVTVNGQSTTMANAYKYLNV